MGVAQTMSAYQVDIDIIDLIVSATLEADYRQERGANYIYLRNNPTTYTNETAELIEKSDYSDLFILKLPTAGNTGDTLGRELIAANCASLAARYNYDTNADNIGGMISYLPANYTYRRICRDKFADYGHVFGALACFEYQSCETGENTTANQITEHTRRALAYCVANETAPNGGAWNWSRQKASNEAQQLRQTINAGNQ